MHVQVGHLSQDSTFDLFEFLSKFFFQNLSFQTRSAAYTPVFTVNNFVIIKGTASVFVSKKRKKGSKLTTDTQPRAGIASLTADRLLKNLLARFFSRKFCNKQKHHQLS